MIETMQKRINEIKQQDRKSYYEIANEIGISECTLYSLMSKGKVFTPAEQKIIAYLKGYLTKDEKLEAYRLDNEELKAGNEKLKHSNENLRLALKTYEMPEVVKVLTDWRTGELDLRINKYKHTLQEIKAIVKKNITYQDTDSTTRAMIKIIDLITKTEEE